MKLFFYKMASSFCIRIFANELNVNLEYEQIKKLQTVEKQTLSGQLLSEISPKNQIPVLMLDDGKILTECSAILIYLAENYGKNLISEGFERYKLLEVLSFISSELHKNFTPIISPIMPEEVRPIFKKIFGSKLKVVESMLEGKTFLISEKFTIADAYFFNILLWLPLIKFEIERFPNIKNYFEKLKVRDSILKSLSEEGILL